MAKYKFKSLNKRELKTNFNPSGFMDYMFEEDFYFELDSKPVNNFYYPNKNFKSHNDKNNWETWIIYSKDLELIEEIPIINMEDLYG